MARRGLKRGQVMINVNDIIGKRIGKLKVISYVGKSYDMTLGGERARHYYKVKCDCGKVKVLQRGQITSELTHSCGCSRKRKE